MGKDLELEVPIGTLVFAKEFMGKDIGHGDIGAGAERAMPRRAHVPMSHRPMNMNLLPTWPNRASACWSRAAARAGWATRSSRPPPTARRASGSPACRARRSSSGCTSSCWRTSGLVGYPNAGKSTLISRISAAQPKIADYPFTTLTPNLGVVPMRDDRSFVVADVPGLIEGAHEGHGLGDRFLKHLERTKVLIHVVDVSGLSGREPADDLDVLRHELSRSTQDLASKPQLVAANKIDAVDRRNAGRAARRSARASLELPFFRISAVAGAGLEPLLEAAWPLIRAARPDAPPSSHRKSTIRNPQSTIRNPQLLLS